MRLINVNTLSISEFLSDYNLPPYAILSHTWSADEVTFQDMQKPRAMRHNSGGRNKIKAVCGVAKRDGLEWAWVDTCCINKDSSAELSEAINSMFRYYQQSTACYAYMDDVSLDGHQELEDPIEDLGKSRWFTRGWTLQELLAPRELQFFDHNWELIGTRSSLSQTLSQITRIPEGVLDGSRSIFEFSVYERLRWAAGRNTTRVEDMAYCLIGLFDVNMPLLYGEGHKAFARLQLEILQRNYDSSVFMHILHNCHAPPSSTPSVVEARRVSTESSSLGSAEIPDGRPRWVKKPASKLWFTRRAKAQNT
ncbi:heterokaryon incompatibility protein-domain-containing protein [Xylaria sp. FL1042]|nr:heterokaryon incompatibility protein-domain-containing protein [Xylaria sp. FL1042]